MTKAGANGVRRTTAGVFGRAVWIAVAAGFVFGAAEAEAQGGFRPTWPFQRPPQRSQSERDADQPSRVSRPRQTSPAPAASSRSSSSSTPLSAASTAITKATVITRPGRYTLTENVLGVEGATTGAIVIAAPDVTLDLGGFLIRGRTSSSPDNCAVAVLADRARVRNGSIEDFGGENQCGLLVGAGVKDFAVEDIRIGGCETGILINPENDAARLVAAGRISRCTVTSGSIGILAFPSTGVTLDECTVTGCIPRRELEGEGSGAVLRGTGFAVRDCVFTGCREGLRLEADGSLIEGTICAGNERAGCVVTGSESLVRSSVFARNGGKGLVIEAADVYVSECVGAEREDAGATEDAAQQAAEGRP